MMPVTGPYTGTANPIRGVPRGGLPVDHHCRDGRPQERRPPAGARARPGPGRPGPGSARAAGTNPVPQFDAVVSGQAISAAGAATVTNVSTAAFPASTAGNADINATVSLPHPCIAPSCSCPRLSSAGSQGAG